MLKLVDSHCHLQMLENIELDSEILEQVLCVSTSLGNEFKQLLHLAKTIGISISVGLHPTETIAREPSVQALINLAQQHSKIVAIGETGLDYFRDHDKKSQHQRFNNHIQTALATNKPLIIHTRHARADTINILKQEPNIKGVLHCFTEDLYMAEQAIDLGFYISFSGIITFNNALELQAVVRALPLERILVETDSPYLTPIPHRGKSNQPTYVQYVAQKIAELKNVSLDQVISHTTQNYYHLFGDNGERLQDKFVKISYNKLGEQK